VNAEANGTDRESEWPKTHDALRTLLSDYYGSKAMEESMGGDRTGVGACALGSLANELLLLSHYCGTTNDADGALQMLEDVLLSMSKRASGAASLAIAEICVTREKAEAAE